jgi:sulfotransferase
MTTHAIAGLPRAGSTLLANLLSQHPDVYVSGTSALPQVVAAIQVVLSTDPSVRSDLSSVPGSYDRFLEVYRSTISAWYSDREESNIFDKGRGWLAHAQLFEQINPSAKIISCVRDPRDVFSSILRQDAATSVFSSELGNTVETQGLSAFGPDGMIGGPIRLVEDAIRRNLPIEWVRYETFVRDPFTTLEKIRILLGLNECAWTLKVL